jgi:copper(I)-binding protein
MCYPAARQPPRQTSGADRYAVEQSLSVGVFVVRTAPAVPWRGTCRGVDVSAQPATKRRIGIGLVAACATLLTSACAAGQDAQTANIVAAIDATNGNVGDLQLANVAIQPPPNGPSYHAGDAAALQLAVVNNGPSADTLQSISSPAVSGYQVFATAAEASTAASPSASGTSAAGSTSASTSPSASSSPSASASASASTSASASSSASASASAISSAASSAPTSLQIPPGELLSLSVTGSNPVLLIRLSKAQFPGTTVPITFTFANSGSITLQVPIQITGKGTAGLTIAPPSSTGAA